MAAEHEGAERAAEEIAQLIYHVQVMMLAKARCQPRRTSSRPSPTPPTRSDVPDAARRRPQQG